MAVITTFSQFRTIFSGGAAADVSGYSTWPLSSVRAVGFNDGLICSRVITASPNYYVVSVSHSVSPDASSADWSYDWYVSQRTDVPADQCFSVDRLTVTSGASVLYYSATLKLSMVQANVEKLSVDGLAYNDADFFKNPETEHLILKNVHVYCRRKSDGLIQWVDLHDAILNI